MKNPQPPRERAARALCRLSDVPENTKFDGRPMWESFLPEVDAVLEAALGAEEIERMKKDEVNKQ
ncbi:hypothetical protein G6L26_007535 [Agrobacterium radiobacter]|uniref:Uncharacterized protein n=1 Tax=Agrobacterium tumefaciens str. B6 TaxID=1183423 RepID=A0A822UZ78_AGRTU|nr:hypothetical protein [Agrobacterium tumefaciens]KWT88030.1 hypothetical protein ASB65_18535 [Agrobacterium tumefaciens str. B6]MQB28172.1 hypothetical protein [Agrobacterium tumefaciens]NTA05023.1 hypothetical protein [Agrobacterium tumefaciens]NTA91618.1 hypothetical protein [Agrobacterium tumefaciens]NTB12768.1 hypothetical protein [Agrobacterium tumefaciens]